MSRKTRTTEKIIDLIAFVQHVADITHIHITKHIEPRINTRSYYRLEDIKMMHDIGRWQAVTSFRLLFIQSISLIQNFPLDFD